MIYNWYMMIKKVILVVALVCLVATQGKDYTDDLTKLQDLINGPSKAAAYNKLAYISDMYGPRMWGSDALEQVIRRMYTFAKEDKFDNVRLEAVKNFTKWVRGDETLTLHSPRPVDTPLKLIGLGGSVSTNGTLRADAVVVNNYTHLNQLAAEGKVQGKIVVYNTKWVNYGTTVQYRSSGAIEAAKHGALAALVRSVTPDSVASVHAGVMHYESDVAKIPFAAITVEDAEMMDRMQKRGQKITLSLVLQNKVYPNTFSNNLVFEIKGSDKPEQILLMGGHIDSWDTGSQTGTNDDAGGFITCYEAMKLIKSAGLQPKRTIRFIAWSGQEWGDPRNGAHAYVVAHKHELHNHIVAFEDDLGSTKLLGFGISGNNTAFQFIQDVAKNHLKTLQDYTVINDGEAADTTPLHQLGIPSMKNVIDDSEDHKYYFTYHHSAADTLTIMNKDDLDSNVLGVAAMFYLLADLDVSLPKPIINMHKLKAIEDSFNNNLRMPAMI